MASALAPNDVFVNCPFDEDYSPLFRAAVFAIYDCGFRARCTLEYDDSVVARMEKILGLVEECRYGVHDLSMTDLDEATGLPRFNMPFELGLFFGAKHYGPVVQRQKRCLILDRKKYRHMKFISDLGGHDPKSHGNSQKGVIRAVRNWLRSSSGRTGIPGAEEINRRWRRFKSKLPAICAEAKLDEDDLVFNDFAMLVSAWISRNPVF